jgi:hypothetical protein
MFSAKAATSENSLPLEQLVDVHQLREDAETHIDEEGRVFIVHFGTKEEYTFSFPGILVKANLPPVTKKMASEYGFSRPHSQLLSNLQGVPPSTFV